MSTVDLFLQVLLEGGWGVAAIAIAGLAWRERRDSLREKYQRQKDEKTQEFVIETVRTISKMQATNAALKEAIVELSRRV